MNTARFIWVIERKSVLEIEGGLLASLGCDKFSFIDHLILSGGCE